MANGPERLPGGTKLKTIAAILFITLAWCLTGRGYFHPF